jgi:hypothetical protein
MPETKQPQRRCRGRGHDAVSSTWVPAALGAPKARQKARAKGQLNMMWDEHSAVALLFFER